VREERLLNFKNFKVVGPVEPLVVEAGEVLVLPCSLQPNISAVDMTVEWIRTDRTDSDKLVHLYEGHKDTNDKQMKSYRGRTALFKEELQKGNTSLKLSAVQPSDEGVYQCYVESGSLYDDVTVHVVKLLEKWMYHFH
uniref:Ig-like domain-containing protein n=1 Tax=Pygocentrus nattereri TaxID=42514 RepID=A0A3B4DS46_PYGNA